jgi:KaiC/GvpD/RAD55 family RecA-like ATPase
VTYAKQLLDAEAGKTIFLEHTVYNTVTRDSKIISVDARDARSGAEFA